VISNGKGYLTALTLERVTNGRNFGLWLPRRIQTVTIGLNNGLSPRIGNNRPDLVCAVLNFFAKHELTFPFEDKSCGNDCGS
jgi:hypothetical protein